MRSPALAIAWELWGRNRGGILTLLAILLACSIPCSLLPPEKFRDAIGLIGSIEFFFAFLYIVSIFTHSEIRIRKLTSGFPTRMFTLPMRTSVLVALSMIY